MTPDRFYKSEKGELAIQLIRRKVAHFWKNIEKNTIMGFGYASHFLPPAQAGSKILCFTPEVIADIAPESSIVVNQAALPLRDAEVDKVIAIHAIENAIDIDTMLQELWRVLKPEGKLMLILVNKHGYWVDEFGGFNDKIPSDDSTKLSLSINKFTLTAIDGALYNPPFMPSAMSKMFEKIGPYIYTHLCGVYIFEAEKHIFAPTKGRNVKITPSLWEIITKPKTKPEAV